MFFREHTIKGEMFSPSLGKWWSCHSSPRTDWRNLSPSGQEIWYSTPTGPHGLHLETVDPKSSFPCPKLVGVHAFCEDKQRPRGVAQPLECQGLPDWKSAILPAPHWAVPGGDSFIFGCPTSVWGEDGKDQQEEDQPAEWEAFPGVEWLQGWTDFHIAASQSLFWILRPVSVKRSVTEPVQNVNCVVLWSCVCLCFCC